MSLERFADLFAGRTDVWGAVHGECFHEQVTDDNYHDHLYDPDRSLGIYPLVESEALRALFERKWSLDGGKFYVHWGCSDIDNPDDLDLAWTLAWNLNAALTALGIESWVERTKGKGYHVWVFAEEWVPAEVMRRAFLVAHQIAGVKATEVNPKSLTGGKTGIGNYVNLPYPAGHEATDRRVMVRPDGTAIPLATFLDSVSLVPYDVLYSAARLYKEPERRKVQQITEPSVEAQELSRCLDGLAYTVWRDGPMEGRDRSGAMARFCHLCAGLGIAPGTTLVLLRDMDARLGKFIDREDREDQLIRLIENAYR